MGKSFNFEVFNPSKKYSNTYEIQDFVLYHKAMYAYVNKYETVAGIDPMIDTSNGDKCGKYWMQICKGYVGVPLMRIDATTYFWEVSYDNGINWEYVLDTNGDKVKAKN